MDFKTGDPGVSFLVQVPSGNNQHKKKHATSDQTTHASTGQASAPEITPASIFHAMSYQGMAGLVVVFGLLFYGLYRLIRWIFRLFTSKDSDGFAKADYTIPHCKTTKTDEGFIVTFTRQPVWLDNVDPANRPLLLAFILIAPFIIGLALFALKAVFKPNRIEITREAVIIDGKKLRRADFGAFYISYTKNIVRDEKNRYAVLGYTYGRQKIELPYLWLEAEANQFLGALNYDLRAAPMAGDESRPSQDMLRDGARPADF